MKRIIFLIVFIATAITSNCQTWAWAKSFGGNMQDYSRGIATDINGNSFIAGNIGDTVVSGIDTLFPGIFIRKYDSNGNLLWSVNCKEQNWNTGVNAIALDDSDNCFITGHFSVSLQFGNSTLWGSGLFVAKFHSDGTFVFAFQTTPQSNGYCSGDAISINRHGDIFISGSLLGTVFFGLTLVHADSANYFVAKYDPSGNFIWEKDHQESGSSFSTASHICSTIDGGCFFSSQFDCNSTQFGSFTLFNSGNYNSSDAFLSKLDSVGNVIWIQQLKGSGNAGISAIKSDTSNNCFLAGSYFNTVIIGNDTLIPPGLYFVAKCNGAGNFIWVKKQSFIAGYLCLALDNTGNIYIGGSFIRKFDPSGNVIGNSFTSPFTYFSEIGIDQNENCYATGAFQNTSVFGTTTLTSNGFYDVFIGKFTSITGINEISENSSLNVYPNPSEGKFQIDSDEFRNSKLKVEIYDILGNKIFNSIIENEKTDIDISSQPSGIYFVRVVSENKTYSAKIIKE